MKLLIDIGNTTTSVGIWENQNLSCVTTTTNDNLFVALKKYYKKDINEILITSVINAKDNKIIKDKLKKLFECKINQIRSSPKLLGVTNGYKQPTKLGDDRWVTIVASYLHYKKPMVIVDCGTTISIDCVNHTGRHLGGYILSGFEGYSKSFYNADNLKKIKLKENNINKKLLFARTTEDALLSGYMLMVTSAIEKTYTIFYSKFKKKPLLIISGGYGKQISFNLIVKAKYEPNLVLKSIGLISDKKKNEMS